MHSTTKKRNGISSRFKRYRIPYKKCGRNSIRLEVEQVAILVTGGTGYIGTHTLVELAKKKKDVIVVDSLVNSKIKALERVKAITNQDFKFYQTDLRDRKGMYEIFETNDIEGVIHFAGLKAVGESVKQPIYYYSNNIEGTLVLLEQMQRKDVRKIVFSSSATVYGMNAKSPILETVEKQPVNPYGHTKSMIEQLLLDVAQAQSSLRVILLRYFNPIGAHASGLIGEDPTGVPNNIMPYITGVAVGQYKHLGIFGNDYPTKDGTGVRDYIHVVDLARGHLFAWEYLNEIKGVEVFNLGTGQGVSVLELLAAFERGTGIRVPYVFKPRRSGDVAVCFSDASKSYQLMGWKAERSVEEMCKDAWEWQSKNPTGYSV